MQEPLLPLNDDELRLVTGAAIGEPEIVKKIREALTHGHDSSRNVWKVYGASTVR
ncbi:MAG TPA: hypothetical protein VF519_01325 [Mycobacteriales bacterium]|jgi:hypothetical protein